MLVKACIVLGEKVLKKELEKLREQIKMLVVEEPKPENIKSILTTLKSHIKSLSEKAEEIFHIPITEPLLESFQPNIDN